MGKSLTDAKLAAPQAEAPPPPPAPQPPAMWTTADDVHYMSSPFQLGRLNSAYSRVLVFNPQAEPESVLAAACGRVSSILAHLTLITRIPNEAFPSVDGITGALFALQGQAEEAMQILDHLQDAIARVRNESV